MVSEDVRKKKKWKYMFFFLPFLYLICLVYGKWGFGEDGGRNMKVCHEQMWNLKGRNEGKMNGIEGDDLLNL